MFRDKFDAVADLLCQEFRLLDHLVNSAVVQQVANVFVETAAPMHKLVGAATSPARQVVVVCVCVWGGGGGRAGGRAGGGAVEQMVERW